MTSLRKVSVFSTLDGSSNFWKSKVEDGNRHQSAFKLHHGLWKLNQMLFDLMNAPETFQQTLDVIYLRLKCQKTRVYIDNIVVFSQSPFDYIEHVGRVPYSLRDAGTPINRKMWLLFQYHWLLRSCYTNASPVGSDFEERQNKVIKTTKKHHWALLALGIVQRITSSRAHTSCVAV